MTRKKEKPIKKADYSDIERALTEHGEEIIEQLLVKRVQLSQPVDGAGARIQVSCEPGEESKIPKEIILTMGREQVAIPLEALDNYQAFKAF